MAEDAVSYPQAALVFDPMRRALVMEVTPDRGQSAHFNVRAGELVVKVAGTLQRRTALLQWTGRDR